MRRGQENAKHQRGIWVHVTTLSPVERWFKQANLASALAFARGYQNEYMFTVEVLQDNITVHYWTIAQGETTMGIISDSNKSFSRPFASASYLCDAWEEEHVEFTIVNIREDEFRGNEQWVFDLDTVDGEAINTGKEDSDGNPIYASQMTVTLTKDSKRTALVTVLKNHGLPYGPVHLEKSGRYILIEDE